MAGTSPAMTRDRFLLFYVSSQIPWPLQEILADVQHVRTQLRASLGRIDLRTDAKQIYAHRQRPICASISAKSHRSHGGFFFSRSLAACAASARLSIKFISLALPSPKAAAEEVRMVIFSEGQERARRLLEGPQRNFCLAGGTRSGKTFLI